MTRYLFLIQLFLQLQLGAQESVDGIIEFQSDPQKKYSLYIPSNYNNNEANAMMVGLHPLNTNRWDSTSWRDTLIVFAESNDLILAVPDGGPDGAIDDPIDTAFTSLLIDSMAVWYNIKEDEKYLMGFSWGGKTVYSYGLRRPKEFAGFIPIGAAISGAAEIEDLIENALYKNWYILHGANDNPEIRFYPAASALNEAGACLETNLLPGVGHTIDFPNRNQLLNTAFAYIRDNQCTTAAEEVNSMLNVTSSPNPSSKNIKLNNLKKETKIDCYDIHGQRINFSRNDNHIYIDEDIKGIIFITLELEEQQKVIKQIIIE